MSETIEEKEVSFLSGWLVFPVWLALTLGTVWQVAAQPVLHQASPSVVGILLLPVLLFIAKGFNILPPNIAGVYIFFGRYAGSLRRDGFFWLNPFYQRQKISLRVNNLTTPALKVNDRDGNPVEVAAVVAWRVRDTAKASFDVEDYVTYVVMQAESAVRAVVSERWYDGDRDGRHSLRGDLDAVSRMLAETIDNHVALAGVEVLEARISHLAYAPEIAGAMLRRQQAVAVVAARSHIVEGSVGMVKQAIEQLEEAGVVRLGDADRVRLVTNLMTVLVADNETQPVLSVGKE